MAKISEERLREMEEEMDRFEAEIQIPGGPPSMPFILRSSTYDKVQAQLTSLRQESSRLQQKKESKVEDVDLRQINASFRATQKRKYSSDEEENEFHDIDERPGRPQGPLVPPPPPPPPPMPILHQPTAVSDASKLFVPPPPPPPPPPEPDGGDTNNLHSTLSFKPYGPGEGLHLSRPAFLPPQLRHRAPIPGLRPPYLRPPMRMGMPPLHYGGQMGFPRPPHMMGPGPQLGQMNPGSQGLPVPSVGVPVLPGPQAMPPGPPGSESSGLQFMTPSLEAPQTEASSAVTEKSQIVYAAAPMITVERKKDEKKKKKKKKKGQTEAGNSADNKTGQNNKDGTGTSMTVNSSADEDKSVLDMEIVPESALVGGIMVSNIIQDNASAAATATAAGNLNAQGTTGTGSKKEKKKKEKKFLRLAANTTWEDPTLAEWQQDDFRMFAGDLGNEVTDETLVRAFNKYPSFLKAKVIRDRRTNKTKGYGFVSFKDPLDFARAMREMNGKYVGNRPIKLRKSSWKDRNLEIVRKKEKEKKKLGLR